MSGLDLMRADLAGPNIQKKAGVTKNSSFLQDSSKNKFQTYNNLQLSHRNQNVVRRKDLFTYL